MPERISYTVLFGHIDKDRKLAEATAECKALKLAERLREKAVEEVSCISFRLEKSFLTLAEAYISHCGICWRPVRLTGRSYVTVWQLATIFVVVVAVPA